MRITTSTKMYQRFVRRLFRKSRKRIIRYGLLATNLAILIAVGVFVLGSPGAQPVRQNALGGSTNSVAANPLDQLSSVDIAVQVARITGLDEMQAVTNNADTVNAQLSITPGDEQVVAKPQIVATAQKSIKDIKKYTTKEGDTISGLAATFGVTSDTIRWSNNLSGADALTAGKELTIAPVNGVVHEVKAGDTPESIAQKYRANKDQIIAFNDAEVGGLKLGTLIVAPDGVVVPVARVAVATVSRGASPAGFAWGGYSPIYGGNGYDYGYCTWWVAIRRSQIGRPIPSNLGNASTWKTLGARAGMGVSNTPSAGAVIWTPPRDYYGHVGFVESINPDGSVEVSDMNVAGWGKTSRRTLSPAQAAAFSYIE